jgi:hypothetical protein
MATATDTTVPSAPKSKPADDGSVVSNVKLDLETKEKCYWIMGRDVISMAELHRNAIADYIAKHNPKAKRFAG